MSKKKTDAARFMMQDSFIRNLETLMVSHGYNNADLAAAVGIPPSDISKYRNRLIFPSIEALAKFCSALNVSFDFMMGVDPGGRYASLSEEEKSIINLYHLASDSDKIVIKTILGKYAPSETDPAE